MRAAPVVVRVEKLSIVSRGEKLREVVRRSDFGAGVFERDWR